MRNFILFIVAVSLLSFAGFVLYRVYIQGESAKDLFHELHGSETKSDVLAEAKNAYRQGNYAEALKGFEKSLNAHESGESGAKLEEDVHKDLLIETADCYKKLWEAGGKTDDTLRIHALRTYEKFYSEYSGNRYIGGGLSELRTPASAPASAEETEDESPPK